MQAVLGKLEEPWLGYVGENGPVEPQLRLLARARDLGSREFPVRPTLCSHQWEGEGVNYRLHFSNVPLVHLPDDENKELLHRFRSFLVFWLVSREVSPHFLRSLVSFLGVRCDELGCIDQNVNVILQSFHFSSCS